MVVFLVFAFLFGACVGSFLNVVILRLPKDESLWRRSSHCFSCGKPIRWYNNIPCVSYLVLRGKCAECGAPFSVQYFVIELLTGLVFTALCYFRFWGKVPFWPTDYIAYGPLLPYFLAYLRDVLLFCSLLAITVIDAREMIIPVTKSNLDLVPDNYIRKQTVVNGERFITPELKELESKLLHAEEQSLEREAKIFQDLRQAVLEKHRFIQESADAVARLDVLLNIAWISLQRDYRRPKICEDDRLVIKAGRHPVVERLLSDKRFVPNDTHLNTTSDQIMLITGPNMAGKSTYIRQVALLVLMAQSGFFIPADSAEIGLADQIFTRVGASDELSGTGQKALRQGR